MEIQDQEYQSMILSIERQIPQIMCRTRTVLSPLWKNASDMMSKVYWDTAEHDLWVFWSENFCSTANKKVLAISLGDWR